MLQFSSSHGAAVLLFFARRSSLFRTPRLCHLKSDFRATARLRRRAPSLPSLLPVSSVASLSTAKLDAAKLESLVHHPIDYARVVKKIGNEVDLTLVDLEGLLPSAIIMVISVTASTTSGKPLSKENLNKTIDACDRALALDLAKKKVLDFVESRTGYIAPNLSAIIGSAVAAKLMGIASGLSALAKMPACNVQLLGAKKKTLAGFSTATSQFRVGYLEQAEIFQSAPPSLRTRACRLLASKSTLAVRVDSTRGDPTGKTGRNLRDEILKKIETTPC
ncbi:hypothetical protein ZIOFF_030655 [Zingiber officinale]|uniref:Nop domain-containing protein n=1 Tax=Zingiber officinale TaxID=94328 RepID=A0A8J5LBW4_ZINOF|nr:hypothetical protein ZIOFF_030655 [Zingiber officinale]